METFRALGKVLCASVVITLLLLLARITHALYFSPLCQVPGPAICKVTSLYLKYFDARLSRNETVYEWHQKYASVILIAPGEVSFSGAPVARELYGAAARHPKSSYFDYLAMYIPTRYSWLASLSNIRDYANGLSDATSRQTSTDLRPSNSCGLLQRVPRIKCAHMYGQMEPRSMSSSVATHTHSTTSHDSLWDHTFARIP